MLDSKLDRHAQRTGRATELDQPLLVECRVLAVGTDEVVGVLAEDNKKGLEDTLAKWLKVL